jgi:hypothetical protein
MTAMVMTRATRKSRSDMSNPKYEGLEYSPSYGVARLLTQGKVRPGQRAYVGERGLVTARRKRGLCVGRFKENHHDGSADVYIRLF